MKEIVQMNDPVLRETSLPVPESMFDTDELRTIVYDLAEALDAQKDGVAIAAPQLGLAHRIFLVRYDRLQQVPEGTQLPADVGVYINPEFVNSSRKREIMDEGCLSIRGTYGKTYRNQRATVRARTEDGRRFERGGGGILAQVFQHEIDHLEGVLFIDHAIDLYDVSENKVTEAAASDVPIETDAL